jgi:hypothetical protein
MKPETLTRASPPSYDYGVAGRNQVRAVQEIFFQTRLFVRRHKHGAGRSSFFLDSFNVE